MSADTALGAVLRQFDGLTLSNPALRVASRRAGEGLLTTAEVQRAAGISGNRLGEFLVNALSDLAGDGQLTSADALSVVPPALRRNYKFVSTLLEGLDQKGALKQAIPAFDAERAEHLADYMAGYERFSDHGPEVIELVENNIRSIVDESERQTALARYRMGMKPTITRSCVGETCQWCADLAGTMEYNPATMNRDIFRRHRSCDCLIELNRDGGREVVNNYSRKNGDVNKLQSVSKGGVIQSGAKKTRGWKERHAERYYEEIRKRAPYADANKIAKNIDGFTPSEIEDIRQHMFIREHKRDGRIARFDASYDQAEVWQRLVSGNGIWESDRIMLLHEQMESRIMQETGCTYEEAHAKANGVYDWWAAHRHERVLLREEKNK